MLRLPFVLLLNLINAILFVLSRALYAVTRRLRRRKRYVEIKLQQDYLFGRTNSWLNAFRAKPTFLEFRRDIKRLAADPEVEGVVVVSENLAMGMARTADIVDALDALRDEHRKHVVAHTDMAMSRDYLAMTVADDILIAPAGRLYTFEPRLDSLFAAEALRRVGATAQFVHVGSFKTASHRFMHDQMPAPMRVVMEELHDGLMDLQRRRISARRGIAPEQVDALWAHAPADVDTARRDGLIDAGVFREDIAHWLEHREQHRNLHEPPPTDLEVIRIHDYQRQLPRQWKWRPLFRRLRKRMVVLDLTGFIVTPGMSPPGSSVVIDPDEVLPVLEKIKKDRRIVGVLLHINSPGGSALASDVIWKGIEELRAVKPVVAYCSDVAASGGYYLAAGADRIVCRAETVTGSIGVIAGKLSFGEGLAKIGVHVDGIYDYDTSSFTSASEPLGPETIANLRDDAREFYRRFLDRVGHARQLPRRRLHRYARGRVYLGEDAFHRGLVDRIGGFDQAVEVLAELCEVGADDLPLDFMAHRRESFQTMLTKSAVRAVGVDAASPVVGELRDTLAAASMLRRESLLALMPMRIGV